MNVTKDNANYTMPCNECQAGQMHRTYLTYFTWLGDELITVPDFPAWVCDVCGKREFDVHALNQLSLLLSPTAGKPAMKTRRSTVHLKTKPTRPSKAE